MRIVQLVQDRGIAPNAAKGAAVHVAAMRGAFEELGAQVLSIHAPDAKAAWEALADLGGADLVYERYALDAQVGSAFARERGIPHVLEVNAPLADEAQRYRGAPSSNEATEGERAMFANAALCLCVSRPVAEYAQQRGAPSDRCLVAPNAVDARMFRPRVESPALRKELFPALSSPFVVGFHGRLRPWHRLQTIVRAAAVALESGVDIALLCVGHGDFDAEIGGALPATRVRCIPWLPQADLARYVAAFHVIPFAYAADEVCYFSPLKLREAMAAGVAPIVPRVGDLAEVVLGSAGSGPAGIVVERAEEAELARAIVDLAGDSTRRDAIGRNARAEAERHTWTAVAETVLERTRALIR